MALDQRGFSLLETLVAVVLISVVGVIVGQLLQRNTMNMVWNRQTRRAAALADMVIEKYDFLATTSFSTLDQFNQNATAPSAFFSSGPNSQDYADMRITTVASLPNADGSRKLDVAIQWGTGGPQQTFRISKYLAAGTGDPGGAPVYVTVLDESGHGVPGFEVRAAHHYNPAYTNNIGTNEVIGYTDASGAVTLNNVAVAAALQPMEISARRPGSDSNVPKSDPEFVQGYYVPPTGTWNVKTLTVKQTNANAVTYDMRHNDFVRMGSISGTLVNNYGSAAYMNLQLIANGVWGDEQLVESQGWYDVETAPDGHYEYNNLAAGSAAITVRGHGGSDPTIPPGPNFDQGYVGIGGNGSAAYIYQMTLASPPPDIANYNLQVRPLGSLNLTAQDPNGVLLPGATVSFVWPELGWGDRGNLWTGSTDTNGGIRLYNLFPGDSVPTAFTGTYAPTSCANPGGYVYDYMVNCSAGQDNGVTLRLNAGGTFQGQVTTLSGTPLDQYQVSVTGLNGSIVSTLTDAGGNFTLCGVGSGNALYPSWPTVTFTLLDLSTRRITATMSGKAVDRNYSAVTLPNVTIGPASTLKNSYMHNVACATDPNPGNTTSDAITTDASGNFGPICTYAPDQGTANKKVVGGPSTWTLISALAIDNLSLSESLEVLSTYYSPTATTVNATSGNTYGGLTVKGKLIMHRVTGTLRDAMTTTPLAGIQFDPCMDVCNSPANTSCPVTTATGGTFGPIDLCVLNRSSSNPGKLSVTVPSGVIPTNNTIVYSGALVNTNLTSNATPLTPVDFGIALDHQGGGM
jgi:prepilin-type N-terminal cleavage/methylation domain-containing protein